MAQSKNEFRKITLVLPVLPHYRIDLLNALHKELSLQGCALTVITGTNAGKKKEVKESHDVNFPLVRNQTIGKYIFKFEIDWQKGLLRSIFKSDPDAVIVLYHAGKINHNIMLLLLQLRGIPYILWGSGSGDRRDDIGFAKRKLKALFKYLFIKRSWRYLCYSTLFQKQLIDQGYPKENTFVAQNTLNVEEIYNDDTLDLTARNYDYPRFLFVGVIFSKKRLESAIEVCARLMSNAVKFRFDIVGSGNHTIKLEEMVNELSLQNHVFFHGAQYGKDLERLFVEANVFLLSGTGGLAINEAMAYSLPVITTPGDGTAYDLIEEEENGFLLDFNYTIEELESKMSYFATISEAKFKSMGENSRKIVENTASMGNMVSQIMKSLNFD